MNEGLESPVKPFTGISDSPQQFPEAPLSDSSQSFCEDSSTAASKNTESSHDIGGYSPEVLPAHDEKPSAKYEPEVLPEEKPSAEYEPPKQEVLPEEKPSAEDEPPEPEVAEGIDRVTRDQKGTHEPELAQLHSPEKPNLEANGQESNNTSIEAVVTESADNPIIQSKEIENEVEFCYTALPPEYQFKIPIQEFDKKSKWAWAKIYKKGKFKVKIDVSFISEVTPPNSQLRQTEVLIQLTVIENYNRNNEYSGEAKVILYDENAGYILKESEEKRKFEENKEYVRFTVSIGAHRELEKNKSKTLKLQVKVRVHESRTYRDCYDKLMIVPNSSS